MPNQVIESYKQRHEEYLQQLLDKIDIPASNIRAALHYSLFPGGKRIRPILVYLLGELLEININILDVIAAAIELTHSYSLIHDDLPAMDNDDLRRGKPSCHKAFDEATAILVGDGLQALAIEVLFQDLSPLLESREIIAISLALIQASGLSGMVSGQALDLKDLKKVNITEDEVRTIHHLKTGKLLSACLEMILAALPAEARSNHSVLRSYIHHLGLVFQMQDDYLDHYAAMSFLGKERPSDAANHKITFARLFSQKELEKKINYHYQTAIEVLGPYGKKSKPLIEVTERLQARSKFPHA